MLRPQAFVFAFIVAPLVLAGCGKQPASAVRIVAADDNTERVVAAVPHFKPAPGASPRVGVLVDGRWYAKGEEPDAQPTAAPVAPDAGKGHVHVTVSLKGVTDFTGAIRVRLRRVGTLEGASDAASHEFARTELIGSTVDTTLLNVTPGDYVLLKDVFNTSGGIFSEDSETIEVVPDHTIDSDI